VAKNGFVFAPKSKGSDNNDLKEQHEEQHKKKSVFGQIGNLPNTVKEYKQNREVNKTKAAEEQLKQARRDYEVAATKAGVQEEQTKVVAEQLKAKQHEQQAKIAEDQMKNVGEQEKQNKEETYWDIKNRVQRSKPENVL